MVELSDTELQILAELWNLIQTGRTTDAMPPEEVSSKTSFTAPLQINDPNRRSMRILRHRITDRT